jgi:glycosyltransferase involved in cell wall biosynthesis
MQTSSRHRGLGRYTLELSCALFQLDPVIDWRVLVNGAMSSEALEVADILENKNAPAKMEVFYTPTPISSNKNSNLARRRIASRLRGSFIASLEPDIVFVPNVFEGFGDNAVCDLENLPSTCAVVASIHDFIPLRLPNVVSNSYSQQRRCYLDSLRQLCYADALAANSRFTFTLAQQLLGVPDAGIVVAPCGYNHSCSTKPASESFRSNTLEELLSSPDSFLLCVGGADYHKNLSRLIAAFAIARKQLPYVLNIVFAGNIPRHERRELEVLSSRLGLPAKAICFLNYVDDQYLALLYAKCAAYVLPSLEEGFGMTVLEAARCGALVCASDIQAVVEVIGPSDALFNPHSSTSIANTIVDLLSNPAKIRDTKTRQFDATQHFTWSASAKVLLDLFYSLEDRKRGFRRTKFPPCTRTNSTNGNRHHLFTTLTEAHAVSRRDKVQLSSCISLNHPWRSSRRLVVDLSEISRRDPRSGIQRVVRKRLAQLLHAFPRLGYEIQGVYATSWALGYKQCSITADAAGSLTFERTSHVLDPCRRDVFFALDYCSLVQHAQEKFYNHLKLLGVPRVFLLHDILPYTHPQWFAADPAAYKKHWHGYLSTLSKADLVFCVSDNTRNEFDQWLSNHGNSKRPKLVTLWNGCELPTTSSPAVDFSPAESDLLNSLKQSKTFLMVGTLEPRKGHEVVLDTFSRLWLDPNHDAKLIIVGRQGWAVDRLVKRLQNHNELGERLHWLSNVEDNFLNALYRSCSCLIAASYGEGFGLPVVEAAAHGLPVIARDIPVFREVGGNWPTYFSSDEPQQLAQTITAWCEQFASLKASAAPPQMPSWDQTGEEMLRALLELHDESAARG